MTSYEIIVEERIWKDAETIVRRISYDNPNAAAKWFGALMKKLAGLECMPKRHPLAPKNDDFEEIREMFLGKRHNKYRILFTIRGREVHVLHVRRGAREGLNPDCERNV